VRIVRDVAVFPRWNGSDVWTHIKNVGIGIGFGSFVALYRSMTEALGALHALGFCHCDIKPTNILCDATRSSFCLADFGSAVPHGTRIHEISPTFAGPVSLSSGVACHTDDYFSMAVTFAAVCTMRKPAWTHGAGGGRRCIRFKCPQRGFAAFPWPPPMWTMQQARDATAMIHRMYRQSTYV
jgi:serine/threonine protein kinase